MRTISKRRAFALCATAAGVLGLAGCGTTTASGDGLYANPIGNAPVTANPTPYSAGLTCLARYGSQYRVQPPRIAVGRISDLTGKLDENGGRQVTQGATLMAMSALGKAGVPLVERYETDVSRLEYKLADNKLISDRPQPLEGPRDYRPIYVGEVSGSDLFLTGGITELNANIRGAKAGIGGSKDGGATKVASLNGETYVLNVAMDLRLVNTRSLDVVDIVSYQKQIVGRELSAGVFAFFSDNVINISADRGGEEPIHLAVRSMIERAVLEMVAKLYGVGDGGGCMTLGGDPLRANRVVPAVASTPAPVPAAAKHAAAPRVEPARPAPALPAPYATPVYPSPAAWPQPAYGASYPPPAYAMAGYYPAFPGQPHGSGPPAASTRPSAPVSGR